MKYRTVGVLAMALMLLVAVTANALDRESPTHRVHQHLTARQPDAGCDCDGSELCTHLPLVIIDTGGVEIPGIPIVNADGTEIGFTTTAQGESMLSASISVMSSDEHNHHPSDDPDLESRILIRARGNSSRYFDKKGYLIRLTNERGDYHSEEMMGMAPHYEWALHGPYLDKSLMRNYMWYNIGGEIMDYAPNVRFCEVVLNGKYMGLYVMTETITDGESCRLDLSEPVDGAAQTGYVLRMDAGSDNPLKNIDTFSVYSYRNLQKIDIQYPRTGDLTEERIDYITQDFSDFEKSLYSYDYDTEPYAWWNDADINSFVDYFILNEFTCNYDAGWRSTYIYRDVRGKYKMVIWDFNSACNNYQEDFMSPQRFMMQGIPWYRMLTKDEHFIESVISRYRHLRTTYLNEDYLINYTNEVTAYLGPAIDRNFEVWGYAFDKFRPLRPRNRNPADHDQALEQLQQFIYERGSWMDESIDVLLQYSHESKVKKFNH